MMTLPPRWWIAAALAAALSSAARPARAEDDAGLLTLDEAIGASLVHFPSVRGAAAEADAALAGFDQARGEWIPDITLRGFAGQYEKPTIVYPIHSFRPQDLPPFDQTVFQGGVFLSYSLFDGGGRSARVREARARVDASGSALAGSKTELIAQVTASYLEVLSRREVLSAHDRRLEALRAELERVRKFREAGRAARVEELRIEAAVSEAEARRVSLAADLSGAERDLTGLTGIGGERTRADNLVAVTLTGTVIAPGDTLVARAFAANPEVREARQSAAAARAGAGAAKATRLPRLELTGAWQVWSDPEGNSNDEWNVGVQLTQPLFTGGELSGRVRESEAGSRRADERVRLAQITTRRAVLGAADRVEAAEARVQSLRVAVERYEEVARTETLALSAGTGIQTEYLDAEADLLTARADLAEARRALAAAWVELARLTGELDPAWITEHLETER